MRTRLKSLTYEYDSPCYLDFGVVVGLGWSSDPRRCLGRSVSTGWKCHTWHIRSDDQDKIGTTLVLQVGGLVGG